jgi:hypothetical protein
MASIALMLVERVECDTRSKLALSLVGWVHQRGKAASASSGF